ncbi:MAG: hypothetical protein IT222_03030 [Crocinitomix sp.]|nr:hypothetical protein [Crocinitomix sp.]
MKATILLIIGCWIGHVNAQSAFYLKPSLNIKSNFTSTSQSIFSNHFPSNPYLTSKNRALSPFKNINIGLGIGYTNEQLKFRAEFSYLTDEVSTMITEHFYGYNDFDQRFTAQNLRFQYALLTHNFGLNFYRFSSKNAFIGFGVRYILSSNPSTNGLNIIDNYGINAIQIDSSSFLSINRTIVASNKNTVGLQVSFGQEISVKGIYLFDFEAKISKNFNHLIYTVNDYSISINGDSKTYSVLNFGKGSGIYLEFSRKLQFYPWKRKTPVSIQ